MDLPMSRAAKNKIYTKTLCLTMLKNCLMRPVMGRNCHTHVWFIVKPTPRSKSTNPPLTLNNDRIFTLKHSIFDLNNSLRALIDNESNPMTQTHCSLWYYQAKCDKIQPTPWVTLRLTSWWPLDLEQEVSLLHHEKRQALPWNEITTDPGSCPTSHVCPLICILWVIKK